MSTLENAAVDELLRAPFSYQQRPRPVPADGRPLWRVPYVLLLVRACRSQVASLQQLHVLNWALRSTTESESLSYLLSGQVLAEQPVVRYEPALDRAVALAGGLDFLRFASKLWRLNDSGRELLADVETDPGLLAEEKRRLGIIGKPLTQVAVKELLSRRSAR